MTKVLLIFVVLSVSATTNEVRFPYNGRAYDIIKSVLGPSGYEVPDCGHPFEHITTVQDNDLGNVFAFDLHLNEDDDRCINNDRQRTEMAVDIDSPTWMHGRDNTTMSYSWKFKLDAGFQETGLFCHLHQIKYDGFGVGEPNVTITARDSVTLEIKHVGTVASSPLSNFKGNWVKVREVITYGPVGCIDLTITRLKDGAQLIRFNKCGIPLATNGNMIRPKWGFYRSLLSPGGLRN